MKVTIVRKATLAMKEVIVRRLPNPKPSELSTFCQSLKFLIEVQILKLGVAQCKATLIY